MNIYLKSTSIFAAAALLAASSINAQTTTTDPVGYTTTSVPAGDDALFGVDLTQAAAVTGVASGVSGATFNVDPTLVADDFNNTHYVLATSGTNSGQWSEVTDNTTTSITTAEALLADTDTFQVFPFWTLATLFVNGGGVGASADPFNPDALVLVNDLTSVGTNLSPGASYFYATSGPSGAGWYENGTFVFSDDVRLTPETYITVRNSTGSAMSIVVTGTVPVNVVGTGVAGLAAQAQDNQLANPYPSGLTLATSGLDAVVGNAADPFNPTDLVLIYDNGGSSGQNISPAKTYFRASAGPSGPGWYENGTFVFSDSVVIPAGGALIVRKGADADQVIAWNPPLPYSL